MILDKIKNLISIAEKSMTYNDYYIAREAIEELDFSYEKLDLELQLRAIKTALDDINNKNIILNDKNIISNILNKSLIYMSTSLVL